MHGAATAIFAVVAHTLVGLHPTRFLLMLTPGFIVAITIHSVFNHFFVAPIINTLVVLAMLPVLMAAVFQQSEGAVSDGLGMGFDADAELLELINSGQSSTSNVGL